MTNPQIMTTNPQDNNGCGEFYDGTTGKKSQHVIFVGPCYYQTLKYILVNKINSKCNDPQT
jgi:DNA-directed RNA polymerase beta subunit